MKQFRLFWTLCRVRWELLSKAITKYLAHNSSLVTTLIIAVGCQSLDKYDKFISEHNPTLFEGNGYSFSDFDHPAFMHGAGASLAEPISEQDRRVFAQQFNVSTVSADEKAYFGFYCKDRKPIRKTQVKITVLLPPLPKGMLINHALKYHRARINQVRYAIKDYFRDISYSNIRNFEHNPPRDLFSIGTIHLDGKELLKHGNDTDSRATYIYYFESGNIYLGRVKELLSLVLCDYRNTSNQRSYHFCPKVVSLQSHFPNFLSFGYDSACGYGDECAEPHILRSTATDESKTTILAFSASKDVHVNVEHEGKELTWYPFWRVFSPSLAVFRNNFLFVLPKEERKKYPFLPVNPIISRNGTEGWDEYLRKFTTLKESPAEDGQSINFEAELDLSLFCAYGRPISDFVTK